MSRDKVLAEFTESWDGIDVLSTKRMADEIVRLRERLATPAPVVPVVTEGMVEAACKVWDSPDSAWSFRRAMKQALTAALTSASEVRG